MASTCYFDSVTTAQYHHGNKYISVPCKLPKLVSLDLDHKGQINYYDLKCVMASLTQLVGIYS